MLLFQLPFITSYILSNTNSWWHLKSKDSIGIIFWVVGRTMTAPVVADSWLPAVSWS